MKNFIAESDYKVLEQRIGRLHLQQRIGIEYEKESRIFGQGINFFHLENWYSIHSVMRLALRLVGLHGRGRRNARKIKLKENPVVVSTLPESFRGFRILQISDLHLDMSPDMPAVLRDRVEELEYDICVLTGDFRAKTIGPYQHAIDSMGVVKSVINKPCYAVLGNHDSIRMVPGLESLGIRVLLNEAIKIQQGVDTICLVGVDDPHYYKADNLEKAFVGTSAEEFTVLLSHSPEIFKHAAYAGVNLMLSGHTHGGQICLPGTIPLMCNARCPRSMCLGTWDYHEMQGYTSAGSGVCIVDVRLNCPPEVTIHRLG